MLLPRPRPCRSTQCCWGVEPRGHESQGASQQQHQSTQQQGRGAEARAAASAFFFRERQRRLLARSSSAQRCPAPGLRGLAQSPLIRHPAARRPHPRVNNPAGLQLVRPPQPRLAQSWRTQQEKGNTHTQCMICHPCQLPTHCAQALCHGFNSRGSEPFTGTLSNTLPAAPGLPMPSAHARRTPSSRFDAPSHCLLQTFPCRKFTCVKLTRCPPAPFHRPAA